jgi:hypothetical protein
MRGDVVISLVLLACTVNPERHPERRPVVRPPQIVELTGAAIDDAIRIGTDDAGAADGAGTPATSSASTRANRMLGTGFMAVTANVDCYVPGPAVAGPGET